MKHVISAGHIWTLYDYIYVYYIYIDICFCPPSWEVTLVVMPICWRILWRLPFGARRLNWEARSCGKSSRFHEKFQEVHAHSTLLVVFFWVVLVCFLIVGIFMRVEEMLKSGDSLQYGAAPQLTTMEPKNWWALVAGRWCSQGVIKG